MGIRSLVLRRSERKCVVVEKATNAIYYWKDLVTTSVNTTATSEKVYYPTGSNGKSSSSDPVFVDCDPAFAEAVRMCLTPNEVEQHMRIALNKYLLEERKTMEKRNSRNGNAKYALKDIFGIAISAVSLFHRLAVFE